jgi:CHASE3 domain sensor protein
MASVTSKLYRDPFIILMFLLFLACIASIVTINLSMQTTISLNSEAGRLFAFRLMQITLGMTIGLTICFLGMVAMWLGLKETASVGVEASTVKSTLQSTGPGALLIIVGALLVYTCIAKEMTFGSLETIKTVDASRGVF